MTSQNISVTPEQTTQTPLSSQTAEPGVLHRLFWLTIPILVEQLLIFLVEFFDTYLSGRFGIEATSAIGTAAYTTWLASLMFSMIGIGGIALVSRAWGAGNHQEAYKTAEQALLCGIVLGSIFSCFAYFMAPHICLFLKMEGERLAIGSRYLQFDALSYPFLCLAVVGAGVIRGTGAMRIPMMVLGSVSLMNVFFSLLFVYGFGQWKGFGIDGIVMGTIISRMLGCCGILVILFTGVGTLKLKFANMLPDLVMIRRILNIGLPAALDGLLVWVGHMFFLRIVNNISDVAFAAHVVGVQIEGVSSLVAISIGQAVSTMVGQSLGANNRRLALSYCKYAIILAGVIAMLFNLLFYFGAPVICRTMHTNPDVQEASIPAIRLLGFFQVPFCLLIVLTQCIRGAGQLD